MYYTSTVVSYCQASYQYHLYQSTVAGVAGAPGARARPPAASGCDDEIAPAIAPGLPATGTLVLVKVLHTTYAQITSVSN